MILSLDGIWQMGRPGQEKMEARVPGTVYEALIHNNKIEDPYWRDNEETAWKLCEEDYEFLRTFTVDQTIADFNDITLVFQGLDTLAEIYLNGRLLGSAQNMHRVYEFSAKALLVQGENEIIIRFHSPTRYVKERHSQRPVWGVDSTMAGFSHIRKAHYMFGWDWGPVLPDMGLWRSASLRFSKSARIVEAEFTQRHSKDRVELGCTVHTQLYTDKAIEALLELTDPKGQSQSLQGEVDEGKASFTLTIDHPELWWPNGYGEPSLYDVRLTLLIDGAPMDSKEYKIGLRQITLLTSEDQWGREFTFRVNGEKIFIKGANYIPEDNFLGRRTFAKTETLLKDCVEAHFNMLRIWGGGHYADDSFLNLCDEYGLLVWQDFPFACALYDLTEDLTENIRQEALDNIRRMRHHACLALWCGNNEIEAGMTNWGIPHNEKLWGDYFTLFERLLPELVTKNSPETSYWPSSPSSYGGLDRTLDYDRGDTHYWDVWHGGEPFEAFQKHCFRFLSEFGFQSFPGMRTIESFTLPEDRNIFSYVMERHQKNTRANGKIVTYLSDYYLYPKDLGQLVYVSQLLQAEAVTFGVEHMRRNRGRSMGTLYWQVNDCWPVASWSSIDYDGRWKALHYAAKRFYAPVLLSGERNDSTVRLNISNDRTTGFTGEVRWALKYNNGLLIKEGSFDVAVSRLSALYVSDLDFYKELSDPGERRRIYLEYALLERERVLSQGSILFVKPKHFKFLDPGIQARVEETDEQFMIFLTSSSFAKSVELKVADEDVRWSDNYFDLLPGTEKLVCLNKNHIKSPIHSAGLLERLRINSLVNLS